MKKIYMLFSLAVISFGANSQAPSWSWADNGKGPGHDNGSSIASDKRGNCYVTGTFNVPTITFGNVTLTSSGGVADNFFLVKYNSAGVVQWADYAGDNHRSQGTCVNTNDSSVIASGTFAGGNLPMNFGNFGLMAPSATTEAFIVKYDTLGNVTWAVTAGKIGLFSMSQNVFNGIDNAGNIYISGEFDDSTIIKKFDRSGNLVWKRKAISSSFVTSFRDVKLCTDSKGNSFVTGCFSSGTTLHFGTDSITNSSNGYEVFVVKYDELGNVVWVKHQGVYPSIYKPSISTDGNGNSFLTGYFLGTYIKFDTIVIGSLGGEEIFIVKFDPDGNVVWAKSAGGANADEALAIRTDQEGNSYITGMFRDVSSFGTTNLFTVGGPDVYVAKYDSMGNPQWAKQAGGTSVDRGHGISLDSSGNVYITGDFTSKYCNFGTSALLNSDTITFPYEMFIARLSNQPTGINEAKNDPQILVYPNPSNGIVHVFIDKFENDQLNTIEIYNLLGECILHQPCNTGHQVIDLRFASSAVYFIKFKTRQGSVIKKIIKE